MSIHNEITIPASPDRVYEVLTSSEQFAAATGMPATIGSEAGAAFSVFGDRISGRQVELIPGLRVVQAWRTIDWEPGVYSIVSFTIAGEGEGSRLSVDHVAYPDGKSPLYPTWHEHLSTGWPLYYLEPIARYLAGQAVPLAA